MSQKKEGTMASHSEMIQGFQEELICSICRDYFTDPVSIECGHSFCHFCLLRNWKEVSTPFSCPECKSVSHLRNFQADVRLGKLTAIAKKLKLQSFQYPGGLGKCEQHQKVQKLFCEDDQKPVCVSCSQSKEHEGHTLQCIDEAAENFRWKLQETMNDLGRKTKNVEQQMANEKKKLAAIKKEIEIQRKNIVSEFQKMKKFQDEEENVYLSSLQAQWKANLEDQRKNINGLSQQNQEIMKRITELQEECKKPDLDLLQDMKGVLNRNETVLQKEIEHFPINITVLPIPGLAERLLHFKVDITLDCTTADSGLVISEDLKSVRYVGVQEKAPNNSEELTDFVHVLGSQSFISRRCYWEVEVPDNTAWCIGICKKSNQTKDFFGLMKTLKGHSSHLYAVSEYQSYYQVQVKYLQLCVSNLKVGIFLDYECGEVSFYHSKERYLIYTFPTTSFSGPLTPFFCLSTKVLNDSSLTICY